MGRNKPVEIPALNDPVALTQDAIDGAIAPKTPGAYVLGTMNANHVMSVSFVGRSDDDLAAKLKRHIGNYPAFAHVTATSAAEAYQMECRLYHELRPSRNVMHPVRPARTDGACPVCGA